MPDAGNGSNRARRGTSTTPKTARPTLDPATPSATSRPRRTKASQSKVKAAQTVSGDALESGDPKVTAAIRRDIAELPPELATSGLAALALALATQIDDPANSATSKSMCAGQLRDTLRDLRELTPADEEADELDDLASRRATRRSGVAAT